LHGGPEVPEVTQTFGPDYADVYDAIYRDKGYETEAALIERILAREGLSGSRELLDLGCGTGNHALVLARRGHSVVGIDRSSSMLAQARLKASAECSTCCIAFYEADIRKLDLGRRFDAVLMMFTVLGYQLSDVDLTATLAVVRDHLKVDGLFIFDVWNGPAVLAQRPGGRHLSTTDGSTCITRKSQTVLDRSGHLCRIHFELQRIDANSRVHEWEEEHVVRYYFLQELEHALRENQLDLFHFRSFPDDQEPADERAWNALGVARAW
jgi:SAM-dependent methyltransferase